MTVQGIRAAVLTKWARQLGHSYGQFGRYVMPRLLNRGNRGVVTGAVGALAARAGETVADIGFGGGLGLRLLLEAVGPGGHVHGADISASALANARHALRADAGRLTLHAGSITTIALPDNAIDGAICVNTVYFVEDAHAAFAEVARVLRPGGRLVLGVADPAFLRKLPFAAYGFIVREVAELRAALAESGLAEQEHRMLGGFHLLVAKADAA